MSSNSSNHPKVAKCDKLPRRRFPFRLSRHLLGQFALPLVGAMAAFAIVALLLAVFDDLPDFHGTEAPFSKMLLYFICRMPNTMLAVIPFSALLAMSFQCMIMGKNQELTAIRSAGLSLLTTNIPVWILCLGLTGGIFFLAEVAEPAANAYVEKIELEYLSGNGPAADESHLSYYYPKGRRSWFFSQFNVNGHCKGVVVQTFNANGRLESCIQATQAHYIEQHRSWRFDNGRIIRYQYNNDIPWQEVPEAFLSITRGFREIPRDIAVQTRPIDQLDLRELLRMRRKTSGFIPHQDQLLQAMIANRMTFPLAPLIAALLAFAFTGAQQGRKSAVKGLLIAIAAFMAFYLLAQFALVLGKNGTLNPTIAGAAPSLLALAASFWFAWKRQ